MRPEAIQNLNRENAARMAQIIRAQRKRLGMDQGEAARLLGIQQPHLSKIERGQRRIQIELWTHACSIWNLENDCFRQGYLDLRQPVAIQEATRVGKYRIPIRYAHDQGSTMRAFRLFRDYGIARLGRESVDWFFLQQGMDPDYPIHADHLINYRFAIDFLGFLKSKTPLCADIPSIIAPLNTPEPHGVLNRYYETRIDTSLSAVLALCEHSKSYDLNFLYQVESADAHSLEISAAPGTHLGKFVKHCNEAGLGNFPCAYRVEFLTRFSTYGGFGNAPVVITHPERHCFMAGADRCVFFIRQTA